MSPRRRGFKPEPAQAHPLVRQFTAVLNDRRLRYADISERAGVATKTMQAWRTRHMPRLDVFDAALNAAGLELVIRPIGTRACDLTRIEERAVEAAFQAAAGRAMKRRSDLTQAEALELLRSEQMEPPDYLSLCAEKGWEPKAFAEGDTP